jgi:hypothetical protein
MTIFPEKLKMSMEIHNNPRLGHPEFIPGSDIQCVGTLKQVQDDWINDF